MAMLVQRSASALSVDYFNPKQDNSMMDAEICRLFGSLNLTASGAVEPQTLHRSDSRQSGSQTLSHNVRPEEEASMAMETEMVTMTDGEGNVQVNPPPSRSGYPFFEIYGPKQFIESIPSQAEEKPQESIEGCGFIQILAAHFAPRLSHLHCSTHDPDFNFLETILAHREAFVAFPFGHRACSSALTEVAFEIERRNNEGQPYKDDPDIDTAIALHNEAWLMSGWYSK